MATSRPDGWSDISRNLYRMIIEHDLERSCLIEALTLMLSIDSRLQLPHSLEMGIACLIFSVKVNVDRPPRLLAPFDRNSRTRLRELEVFVCRYVFDRGMPESFARVYYREDRTADFDTTLEELFTHYLGMENFERTPLSTARRIREEYSHLSSTPEREHAPDDSTAEKKQYFLNPLSRSTERLFESLIEN